MSNQLYHLLFGNIPVVPARIIVSPDGHFFPFEALVTSVSNNGPIYFLENHAVTYTYSARYLLNQFSEVGPAFKNFLGIAPLRYPNNPNLPDLTGSDESLIEIEDYFSDPDKLVALKASRYNFMHRYSDYKIVQLYTHASDTSSQGEPVIWFSDSVLYLSDLISQKRPFTRLIVLSACQTAEGRLYKGEGVFSFNRGFAALGIPSAITNLWSVDSKSTYAVTSLFYKYLADGEPTDIALQKAKLEFIKMNPESLPFHWAAPILTGKAEVIELRKSISWIWIVSGFFILSILWFGWNKRMRSVRASTQINGSNTVI
jgi:CHAT domain-containing protein